MNFKRTPKNLRNYGKYLKILACLLKQPQYQKYVLKKTIWHILMINKMPHFDDKQNENTFKNFFLQLAPDLVNKLLTAKNIFRENSVKKEYSAII